MCEHENALSAVLEHPGDVAARLAYASALDACHDPLGEFIRLECQLDRTSDDEDDVLELQDRRRGLLAAHREAWLAPLAGIAESVRFERGLVGAVVLDLDTYLTRGAEIFGRFPVRSVAIRGVPGRMGELLASPWMDRIEYLSLREPEPREAQCQGLAQSSCEELADGDVEELAASDRPRHIRGIDLRFNRQLGPRSVEAILNASWCRQLEFLGFCWTAVGDEGAALIASTDRLDDLRRLDLSNSGLGSAGARALAESPTLARLGLTELNFSLNHEIGQEVYAHAPFARPGPSWTGRPGWRN